MMTHRNPLGTSETLRAIYDPLGNYVPFTPYQDPRPPVGSYNSASMGGLSASQANPDSYAVGCIMDGMPTTCNRAMQVINRDQARSVSVHGLASSPIIMRLMASYISVNYTRTLRLEPDGSISDTITPGGETGHFEGGFFHNYASWTITRYVMAPGAQLSFDRLPLLPQNSGAEAKASGDPCAHLLPANIPPNVSVDKNIELGELLYDVWSMKGQSEPGSGAASAMMLNYNRPEWFRGQTGDRGPMDYKYLTTDMRYDDFGNFNYGAVGAAIQYSADTLLKVAGWVQQQGQYAYLGKGKPSSTFYQALAGAGGEYPYGDKPGDAIQIQKGIDYYNCRKKHLQK